jgi:hypothetical protein
MGLLTDLKARFRRERVTLALDDIQALILRSRPEPYVGIHAMLHFDEAEGGRDLLLRLASHIPSAAGWTEDREAWIGAALSFQGLKALGLPEASLKSFPLPFQQGMAARAEQLRDVGDNAPEHWDEAFRPGACHLALTIYARDEAALEAARATAMGELARSRGVTLLGTHAFGADADAKNPFGFRDSISQPAVAGSGVDPLPGQERTIAAKPGPLSRCPIRPNSVATAHSWCCASTPARSEPSTISCAAMPPANRKRNCWPPSWSAAGAAARPWSLRPNATIRNWAPTRRATTPSTFRRTRAASPARTRPICGA